jgi:Zinc-binding dehydrogenase
MLMWVGRRYLWRWLPGGKRARGYSINVMRALHPGWFREDLERLFAMLATGTIRPRVANRISFDEIADAHRRLEAGGLDGKLVLCPDLLSSRSRPDAPAEAESSVGTEGLASDAASSVAQPESPPVLSARIRPTSKNSSVAAILCDGSSMIFGSPLTSSRWHSRSD